MKLSFAVVFLAACDKSDAGGYTTTTTTTTTTSLLPCDENDASQPGGPCDPTSDDTGCCKYDLNTGSDLKCVPVNPAEGGECMAKDVLYAAEELAKDHLDSAKVAADAAEVHAEGTCGTKIVEKKIEVYEATKAFENLFNSMDGDMNACEVKLDALVSSKDEVEEKECAHKLAKAEKETKVLMCEIDNYGERKYEKVYATDYLQKQVEGLVWCNDCADCACGAEMPY